MPFLSLILTAGLAIDCEMIKSNSPLLKIEKWEVALCVDHLGGYNGVELKPVRTTSRQVSASGVDYSIGKPKAGRIQVKRTVLESDGKFYEISTHYMMKAFDEVWVARKNIPSNKVVRNRWVKKENRDVSRYIGMNELLARSPVELFTEKPLRKGQIIFSDSLNNKPFIKEGEKVKVLLVNEDIQITMDGIILGHVYGSGELVDVKLKGTGKVISGEIDENKIVHYSI